MYTETPEERTPEKEQKASSRNIVTLFTVKSINAPVRGVLKRAKSSLRKAKTARHNFIMLAESVVSTERIYSDSVRKALERKEQVYTDAGQEIGTLASIVAFDMRRLTKRCKKISFLEKEVMHYCDRAKNVFGAKDVHETKLRGRLSLWTLKRIKKTYLKLLELE